MAESGPELVVKASPCEQWDLSAATTLLGSLGKHQSPGQVNPCGRDSALLGMSDPSRWHPEWACMKLRSHLSSCHVVSPNVAWSKAKPQICSEPSVFKRFGAWCSAQGSKCKCIHEVQMGRFSSWSCLSAASLYLGLLHLHGATWTCIKTIPVPRCDLYSLVQQQIIICLTAKTLLRNICDFFPSAKAWKYIWNILWVHCTPDGNIYDCFLSGYIKNILSQLHCFYQLYSFILCSFWPGIFFFWASEMSLWPLWYALPNGRRRNPGSEVQQAPLNQWDGVIHAYVHVQIAVWERAKAERGACIWFGLRRGYWPLPFCVGPVPSYFVFLQIIKILFCFNMHVSIYLNNSVPLLQI